MRLLLIHHNFPAQFRDLIGAWKERGQELVALGAQPLAQPIEGLTHLAYGAVAAWEEAFPGGPLDADLEQAFRRGWLVAQACRELRDQGFEPDAVIVHSSWGEALHLRTIWPQAVLLAYPELYGSPACLGAGFDPEVEPIAPELEACIERKNLLALAAIQAADRAVVPTEFQRSTFPLALQRQLDVIHEGVDTDRVAPNFHCAVAVGEALTLRAGDPVVTFASRHLEPLRGFHQLMKALPALLQAHSGVQVLIAGELEGQGYGPASDHPLGYGGALLEQLGDRIDRSRVHFLGRLPYGDLLALMQISAAHVYLTYPYTLSWSLLEAMACGAAVVGSAGGPLAEVISHGRNGLLVPFADTGALAAALLELLLKPELRQRLGRAARRTVVESYGLARSADSYLQLIQELQARRRP
ncbi:MAG: glycosyltransferase [Prochlorococcaceae cyanobacterium]